MKNLIMGLGILLLSTTVFARRGDTGKTCLNVGTGGSAICEAGNWHTVGTDRYTCGTPHSADNYKIDPKNKCSGSGSISGSPVGYKGFRAIKTPSKPATSNPIININSAQRNNLLRSN